MWGISSLSALYCTEECKWFMIKTQADHSLCHVCLQMSRSGISNSLKAHEPLVWRWRLTWCSKTLMKKPILLRRWPGIEKPERKFSQGFKIYEEVLLQRETLIIVKGTCLLKMCSIWSYSKSHITHTDRHTKFVPVLEIYSSWDCCHPLSGEWISPTVHTFLL